MMVLLLHSLFPALAENEMRRNISSAFFYCLLLKNILCIIFLLYPLRRNFPFLMDFLCNIGQKM